jgi:hypothetical protein
MLRLTNIRWATTGYTKTLRDFEKYQMAKQIQDFLLRNYSIVCDIEIEEDE